MAGKWHIDASAYADGVTKALPFGRLVQAYAQGYENSVPKEAMPRPHGPGIDAYTQGQADAALGLNPGFTATVAPEPPPDPPPERRERHKDHKDHKK